MELVDHCIWNYLCVVQSERKVEATLTVPSSYSGLYRCSAENKLGSKESILKFYESGITIGFMIVRSQYMFASFEFYEKSVCILALGFGLEVGLCLIGTGP